jgi:hypothetical protein
LDCGPSRDGNDVTADERANDCGNGGDDRTNDDCDALPPAPESTSARRCAAHWLAPLRDDVMAARRFVAARQYRGLRPVMPEKLEMVGVSPLTLLLRVFTTANASRAGASPGSAS